MARVEPQDVLDIMPTATELTATTIVPFITSANVFVTASLDVAALSLTDEVLTEIEKWLAAHMATLAKDRVSKEEGAGGAYIKWAGTFGTMLNATQFGQMCLILDTSGVLSALQSGKNKAWIKAIPGV